MILIMSESILHLKANVSEKNNSKTLVIPKPPGDPLLVWTRSDDNVDTHSMEKGNLDKYITECLKWPDKTNILCYNCCHSFSTTPVPLPYSYDEIRKIYKCRGNFCSWQCAKAYNMESIAHTMRGMVNMNISLLAYRVWVKYLKSNDTNINDNIHKYTKYLIKAAQNKKVLKSFGGRQSIEEYRAGFFGIVPPEDAISGKPFITVKRKMYLTFSNMDNNTENEVREEVANPINTMNTMNTSTAHKHANDFCDKLNKAKQEKNVIKRKREDNTKNTLLSSMGVKVAQRKDDLIYF